MVVFADLVLQFFNMNPAFYARVINIGLTNLFYVLNPLPAFFWTIYLDYQIHRDQMRSTRLLKILSAPLVLIALLTVWSNQSGFLFSIDSANVYARGSGFMVLTMVMICYMLLPLFQVLYYRKKVQPFLALMVLLVSTPALIGGMIQAFFFGVYTLWASVSISILIMYLNYEDRTGIFDRLRQNASRSHLDRDIWNRD